MYDVLKKMHGDIKVCLQDTNFKYKTESVKHKVIFIGKLQEDNKVNYFAMVYKHPCGDVVVTPTEGYSLALDTLHNDVIPIMMQFDEFLSFLVEDMVYGKAESKD